MPLTTNGLQNTEYSPKMYVRSPLIFMSKLGIQDTWCFAIYSVNMLSTISKKRGNQLARISGRIEGSKGLFLMPFEYCLSNSVFNVSIIIIIIMIIIIISLLHISTSR